MLLLAATALAIATPALAATHGAQGAQRAHGVHAARASSAVHATSAAHGTAAARATQATAAPATLTASITPARPSAPGGVCQVPGIGDIGGLIGLCNSGTSGLIGAANNICQPSTPQPEQATGGINAMVQPPAAAAGGKTLYDNYGVAGQFWAAHGLQCSDMTSLIGNNVAGMVFDAAKSVDRVTITVYQSAAGNNILTWLQDAVNRLITALGNAIYFPFLAPVIIIAAIWLAWQGLIRKRATRTIEGTLWMVVACVAAIALIGRPAAFTGVGTTVSNGVTEVLNTAFSKLPAPAGSNCLPVQTGDPQSVPGNFAYTSGNALVDENANELWSVLVCKPWLYGELGTTAYAANPGQPKTVVNQYGRQLLWAQAIAANETPSTALIQAKQSTYTGIASSMQQANPAVYPLFQGNQWTSRLEIAFAAMFAALVAGLLILLIALTLIVLKLGFLLLLVAGPFFLIVGTHPGFGRVIAIRWFEMLVGVLMKQAAIAIVLSVLLYCYSLIMGTADAVLPWALKILMIALVTVAVFIYRKPFAHLFSAVGYGTIGSTERAEYSLREAGHTFRRSTLDAATAAVPGMASYRAARWARRHPGHAAAAAAGVAAGAGAGVAAGATAAAEAAAASGAAPGGDAYASRLRPDAPPPVDADGEGGTSSRRLAGTAGGAGSARLRNAAEADGGGSRTAPPLDLPPRGTARASAARASAARTGGTRPGAPAPRPAGPAPASPGSASPVSASRGSASSASASTGSAGPASGGPAPAAPRLSGAAAPASGWSRGAGRSAASSRPRAASPGPLSGPAAPVRGRAGGAAGSARSSGTSGSSGSGPAWPASGWPTAGARQRSAGSGGRARSNPASSSGAPGNGAQPPADQGGRGGGDKDQPPATPFWLRPIRRDK
ncbi:MAG TPA: type IV secretion system protein [Streptosporangiaceae bacterium]|nr:type IV secretion system protein [Streptosporangiaceae bacterium]